MQVTQDMINTAAGAVDIAKDELVIALFLEVQGESDLAQEQVAEAKAMLEQALAVLSGERIDQ